MEQHVQDALTMFRHHGCTEDALVSKQRLTDILNKQATTHALPNFTPQILEEIWGQAETTSRGQATALTFSCIYAQAAAILQQRIQMIDRPGGTAQKEDALLAEQCRLIDLQADYELGLLDSYDRINSTRKNIVAIQNKIKELRQNRQDFQRELDQMTACLRVPEQQGDRQGQEEREGVVLSRLQTYPHPQHVGPSQDLAVIFKLAVAGGCLQMGLMAYHSSFLPLLTYLLILFWLFLGYYDQYFVKTLIFALIAACLLDLTSIILSLTIGSGSSRLQSPQSVWRWVAAAALMLQFIIRAMLASKMWPFVYPRAGRVWFVVWGREVVLQLRSGKAHS